uniref:Scv016-like protein n=1 Tax=Trachysalambria curvirostris nimavirus TaxID=2984282 RepID=A0A9C7EZ22_9VIRU|nr:MAG: scv016-like protein [Trachysalambria curvirostris nimavirus]
MRQRIFFDSPKLNFGYCLERYEGEVTEALSIDPATVESIPLHEYKYIVKGRRKSKHWKCILVDRDIDPIVMCSFPRKVSAAHAARAVRSISKNLCFPCQEPDPKRGRKASDALRSIYYTVTRKREQILDHLGKHLPLDIDAVDAILHSTRVHNVKLDPARQYALVKCWCGTYPEEMNDLPGCSDLICTPLRKRKYESLVKEYCDAKLFINIGKGIRDYQANTFYFERARGDDLRAIQQMQTRELHAIPSLLPDRDVFYHGIVKFFLPKTLESLAQQRLSSDLSWGHINETHGLRQFREAVPMTEGTLTYKKEGRANPCRITDTSRYVYWLDTLGTGNSLEATTAKLPSKDWWAGMVQYKGIGVIVKTTKRRLPHELPFFMPITAARYRRIVKLMRGNVIASLGETNLAIGAASEKNGRDTRFWRADVATGSVDSEMLVIGAALMATAARTPVSPPDRLFIGVYYDDENRVIYMESKRNLTKRDLPGVLKRLSSSLTKAQFSDARERGLLKVGFSLSFAQ